MTNTSDTCTYTAGKIETSPYYGQVFPVELSPVVVGPARDLGPSSVSIYGFTWIDEATQMKEKEMSRRFVRVLIIDPDERIPVKNALLYIGKPCLVDSTDEEMFLSLDLGSLLKVHNTMRVTILDEEETRKQGRDICLGPIKIRDLAKRVVVIARF